MYTALRATSQTLVQYLRQRFETDPLLAPFFNAGAGGTMLVALSTPQEMVESTREGLSVWLYRVIRDDQRLNAPPERVSPILVRRPPLPMRLNYLITPITDRRSLTGPETEQLILGKVLQTFHDRPIFRGTDLQAELSGTEAELNVRLEPLSLEELTRIWEALQGSYQLSVSYEVTVVNIESATEPERVSPVIVSLPEYGVRVGP